METIFVNDGELLHDSIVTQDAQSMQLIQRLFDRLDAAWEAEFVGLSTAEIQVVASVLGQVVNRKLD